MRNSKFISSVRIIIPSFYGLFIASFFVLPVLANPNSGITYHGRIVRPDTRPLEGSHVQFRLQIRTPGAENCLLFEEIQTKDMRNSNGIFSLTINDGTGSRGADEYAPGQRYTLDRIFQNRGHFPVLSDCQGFLGYSPTPADGRRFVVFFRDETMPNWEPLPATLINFVPLAIESRSLGGFNASHLLRVTDDGTANGNPASALALTSSEAAELKALAGGTSTRYLQASPDGGAALPSYPTLTPPASPVAGSVWYDSDAKVIKFFDGTNPVILGSGGGGGSGTVTSVTAGDGLAGGSFTVSGTISLPDVGTSGTYYKVVTDAKGRVTSGAASLSETDLPTISTAGKVSGNAITSGTLGGSVSIDTTGTIKTSGALTSGSHSTRLFDLYDSDNTHRIRFQTPVTEDLTADYTLTWPETAGSNDQVLTTNGLGVLSWKTVSGSPTGTAGGDLDGSYPSPTFKEIVTAGTGTKISYDAKGRVISSAALDAADIPSLDWSKITAGQPTTLSGYGITDAVLNAGGVTSVQSGNDADKPVPATVGRVYLAVDTQKIYRDNGASWDVVASVDAGGGGMVTGVTASAPLSSSGGVAPNITISQATTSTNGYLSSTDWNTFNSKLGAVVGSALNEGEIWVGNGSNQAAPATPGGDVSMSNVGSFAVTGIQGFAVSMIDPTLSGQVLRYDLDTTSYAPAFLSLADIRSTTSPFNPMFPNTSCTAAQTLNWSSLTDTLTCTPIAIDDSAVTFASKAAGQVFAGPTTGPDAPPAFRALVESDIPDLSAAKITSGTLGVARGGTGLAPVAGDANKVYGINAAGDGSEFKTMTGGTGVTITHTTGEIEISAAGSGGTVTTVSGTAPITVTDGSSTPTISMAAATASVDGYLTAADFTAFNNKLTSTLGADQLFIGNVSNVATAGYFGIGQLRSTVGGALQFPTSCSASQTLTWSSLTDTLSCTNINGLDADKITTGTFDVARIPNLNANKINAGTLAAAQMPALTGDVTTSAGSVATSVVRIQGHNVASTAPTTNQVLKWSGTEWEPAADSEGVGTVTNVATGTGLTGGPIIGAGTISIADSGVGTIQLADNAVTTAKIGDSQVTDVKIASMAATKLTGTIDAARFPTSVVLNGGNPGAVTVGTNDATDLTLETNNSARVTVTSTGEVGIGTASPGSATAALLQIGDSVTASANARLLFGKSVTTAESNLPFIQHANILSGTSNDLAIGAQSTSGGIVFYTGTSTGQVPMTGTNTAKMVVSASGNVGVGTTSPVAKLSLSPGSGMSATAIADKSVSFGMLNQPVSGRSAFSVVPSNSWLSANDEAAFGYYHPFDATNAVAGYKVFRIMTGTESGSADTAATTIQDRFYVRKDGGAYFGANVGIGTTSPSYQLSLEGTYASALQARFYNLAVNGQGLLIRAGETNAADRVLQVASRDDTKIMTVNSNGNVGIGTTTPAAKLDVAGGLTVSGIVNSTLADSSSSKTSYLGYEDGTNRGMYIVNYGSNHASYPSRSVIYGNYSGGAAGTGGYIDFNTSGNYMRLSPAGGASGYLQLYSGGTASVTVDASGNVGIGTTGPSYKLHVNGSVAGVGAYNALSDRRLKTNIRPLENPLEKILALRGVHYSWRKNEFPQYDFGREEDVGVIAQEVEAVLPEAVTTASDGFMTVAYTKLMAPLIEAFKEFHRQWRADAEAKEERIRALESQNRELRDWICMRDPDAGFCKRD